MRLFFFFVILLSVSIKCIASADPDSQRLLFLEQINFLIKGSGKWKAENPVYKNTDEWSIRYYGYEFEKGIEESTLKLRITGYIPSKLMKVIFWEGFYYWDYIKNRLSYISVNLNGQVAIGSSDSINVSLLVLSLTLTNKNGEITLHKDTHLFSDDKIQSVSLKWEEGRWIKNSEMLWRRE